MVIRILNAYDVMDLKVMQLSLDHLQTYPARVFGSRVVRLRITVDVLRLVIVVSMTGGGTKEFFKIHELSEKMPKSDARIQSFADHGGQGYKQSSDKQSFLEIFKNF